MIAFIIMTSMSALSVLLGFVALLTQKIYIDSSTNQPTDVDIPFFGKLKTNYPALIFVFLGFAMAYATLNKCYPIGKTQWVITGSFKAPDGKNIRWEQGSGVVIPSDYRMDVNKDGVFEIDALIEEGKQFEDVIERIVYTHNCGSQSVVPKAEYDAYKGGKESLIKSVTKSTREYRPIPITLYPCE